MNWAQKSFLWDSTKQAQGIIIVFLRNWASGRRTIGAGRGGNPLVIRKYDVFLDGCLHQYKTLYRRYPEA